MRDIPRYSIVIEWSDVDRAYVVMSPEWVDQYVTPIAEGKTIEEAAKRGGNALDHMIHIAQEDGKPLPVPHVYDATKATA